MTTTTDGLGSWEEGREGGETGNDGAFDFKILNFFNYFILYLKIMFDLLLSLGHR